MDMVLVVRLKLVNSIMMMGMMMEGMVNAVMEIFIMN